MGWNRQELFVDQIQAYRLVQSPLQYGKTFSLKPGLDLRPGKYIGMNNFEQKMKIVNLGSQQ